ncbi:SDR family oxidoreductase [Mycobacterium sp. ITM-2016-00317]|uniref:SDR family oxidoreductase n=1 Tax=Mycobacterium sp. ITM-2016-00317 TaxID=2099694 RepID=UPI00287FBE0A|nr:SDR family oxidoreductase [Mycobacterium sp. ITM-2016-00317]WNG88065.1 SDR family oxidoreductase [Mycobacterium sp. ITM-2016-00317]
MKLSLRPLSEQVMVITGASSGIGLVTARMAAREGVGALVLAARNEDALSTLTDEIRAAGGKAVYVVADVGEESDVQRIADTAISEFGRFDTWVNNAGVSIFGNIMDVSTEDFRRVFDTVFWGVAYGSRAAVAHFRTREPGTAGALINVGSFFGDRATPVQSTYGSAKFAVHGFTEALRMEAAHEGIPASITLVHPGRIDTPYNEHAHSYQEQQPAHRGMIYPPEAVAEGILYAATHPKRDVYVGAQAKLLVLIANIAPRVVDRVMQHYQYWSQRADRPSRSREDSALYKPGHGLQERGTQAGHVRSGSYYVKATTHPAYTALACLGVAAGGAGAAAAAGRRRLTHSAGIGRPRTAVKPVS